MLLNALMTCHKDRYKGDYLFFGLHTCFLHSYRFAGRSARYIHAYVEGLTGGQAAYANRIFHKHRELPPELIEKARKRFL
jgi:hypothetical protein